MAESAEIARWIRGLASPDSVEREQAACDLWFAGMKMISPALSLWMQDAEFRNLARPPSEHPGARPPQLAVIVVGVAVHPENFDAILAASGSPRLAAVPPDQDAKEFELRISSVDLDILTTRDPAAAGAIARFLQKFGEGIQQVELYVRDVDRATEILRSRFHLEPVYPSTRPGADSTRVNFFLAPAAQGKKVLVELVEARPESQP